MRPTYPTKCAYVELKSGRMLAPGWRPPPRRPDRMSTGDRPTAAARHAWGISSGRVCLLIVYRCTPGRANLPQIHLILEPFHPRLTSLACSGDISPKTYLTTEPFYPKSTAHVVPRPRRRGACGENRVVKPARYCPPRHRMPFSSGNQGTRASL